MIAGLNEVDYSHYPDRAFQMQWLRSYLEAYKEHKGQAGEVTDREVEIIYVQVNRFALVSMLYWTLIMSAVSYPCLCERHHSFKSNLKQKQT